MIKTESVRIFLNGAIEFFVLAALFTLPFSKSMLEIFVSLAIAFFFVKKLFIEKGFNLKIDRRSGIMLGLFAAANILSLINSAYFMTSFSALFSKVFKWCLLFIVVADTMGRPAQARRLVWTMVASSILILIDAYYQYLTGYDFLHYPNRYPIFKLHDRWVTGICFPTASFPFPNDFAAWINVFLFTFVALAAFGLTMKKDKEKIFVDVTGVFLAFALFLTNNRGAMIAAVTACVILALMNLKRFLKVIFVIFFAVSLLCWSVPYLNKFVRTGVLGVQLSFQDRVGMWKTGVEVFKQHPVIGNGVNTFFVNFKHFRQDEDKDKFGSYAHNCYLQMASDIGITGLVSFLGFVGFTFYAAVRRVGREIRGFRRALVIGLCLGLLTFLIHAFVDTNLYSLNLAGLFWICMGYLEGTSRSCQEVSDES